MRKSLSTRSGQAVGAAATLLAPAAMRIAAGTASEPLGNVPGPWASPGMLSALVLVSLGVLSTAGEWSHGTVQTTFLLVPQRGRVMATKAVAVALMGAVFAAVAAALAAACCWSCSWSRRRRGPAVGRAFWWPWWPRARVRGDRRRRRCGDGATRRRR